MIIRVLYATLVLVFSVCATARAQNVGDGQPPPFGPCGPPATLPNPNYSLVDPHEGESGVEIDRKTLVIGLDSSSSASFLQSITLVPVRGFVVDVAVPKSPTVEPLDAAAKQPATLGGIEYTASVPLPFIQVSGAKPFPYLEPNTTYVLVLRIVDPNSPPKCTPIIWTMSFGSFTTGPRRR